MTKHNADNERIKRQYFTYLKEANRKSEASVDAVAKAISRFEADSNYRDFKSFHHVQAVAFKGRLSLQRAQRSGETLSKATLHATLAHLKKFFHWLAGQPGFRSHLQYSDAEFFNLSGNDARIATARREVLGPTVEQVRHVIGLMPTGTSIERRDQAIIAFILLTGARDLAITSFKIKHVNLEAGCVEQDAREVRTKFSKTFTTFFFPVGDDLLQIVTNWIEFLRKEELFGPNDPLFPATQVSSGPSRRFEAVGLSRRHWRSAAAVRTIFRDAFTKAGLPYFNPHSFRNTLVRLGLSMTRTQEQFKAWSQNLGHESVATTLTSYGEVGKQRQGEILRSLSATQSPSGADISIALELIRRLRGGRSGDESVVALQPSD